MRFLFLCVVSFLILASRGRTAELVLNEGECWSYDARSGEEGSFVVIRKIETLPGYGEVVHVSVLALKIKSGLPPTGYMTELSHLAFFAPALRASLKERIVQSTSASDWTLAYDMWRKQLGEGHSRPSVLSVKDEVAKCTRVFTQRHSTVVDEVAGVAMSRTYVRVPSWQIRRSQFKQTMDAMRRGDPSAPAALEAIVWSFKTEPFIHTPMEWLELYGFCELPRNGVERTLPRIIATMAVGWYDVLRFASSSARAEIERGEGFFNIALLVAGESAKHKVKAFRTEHPVQMRTLIAEGFRLAESQRHDTRFDHRWPISFGENRDPLQSTPELPRQRWAAAWEDAKTAVVQSFEQLGE